MMIRNLLAGAALALLLIAVGPQAVHAQWAPATVCAGVTFNPCVEFELVHNNGSNYSFVVRYASVVNGQPGYMTAAGLYDFDGDGSPYQFTNVKLEDPDPSTGNWYVGTDGCNQLNGGGGGSTLFEGCVATKDGINSGVPYTEDLNGVGTATLVFSFDSNKSLLNSSGEIDYTALEGLAGRVHIQGVDEYKDCSFKLDTDKGLVSTDCYGPVVPEPMTVVLLATGLVGLGAVGYRNRRKEEDEVA